MEKKGISKFIWPGVYLFLTIIGIGGVWFWGLVLYFLIKTY